jgi:hypothetical protein
MASDCMKVFGVAGLLLGSACTPTEDAGECNSARPCTARGEVCDEDIKMCIAQDLDVDATAEQPGPASFSGVTLPFFRGKVCMATKIKPGDAVPVKLSPCIHPCVAGGGFTYKKQYSCVGSACEALVIQYYNSASGSGCPADAFGRFDRSQCVYEDIKAGAGPFTIPSGAVTGSAAVEIPFLTNEDARAIMNNKDTAFVWETAKKYPQDAERVFQVSMNAANPGAPADCSDESLCDCREIGF